MNHIFSPKKIDEKNRGLARSLFFFKVEEHRFDRDGVATIGLGKPPVS